MHDLSTYEGRRAWIEDAERALHEARQRELRAKLDAMRTQREIRMAAWRMLDESFKRAEQRDKLADTYVFIA
jgi:hypothetical protein